MIGPILILMRASGDRDRRFLKSGVDSIFLFFCISNTFIKKTRTKHNIGLLHFHLFLSTAKGDAFGFHSICPALRCISARRRGCCNVVKWYDSRSPMTACAAKGERLFSDSIGLLDPGSMFRNSLRAKEFFNYTTRIVNSRWNAYDYLRTSYSCMPKC